MKKKFVFVIQVDIDKKYETQLRHALYYLEQKIIDVFKGQMKLDEVKGLD